MQNVWFGPALHAIMRGLAGAINRSSTDTVGNVRRAGYLDALNDLATSLDLPPVDALEAQPKGVLNE